MCFGARGNQFGHFQVEFGGAIEAVKLLHIYGLVTCGKGWRKWGCAVTAGRLGVLVTNASDSVLLPMGKTSRYKLNGYHSNSPEIVFSDLPSPIQLSSGQELRLWFDADYINYYEYDNRGKSCADVFAKYL